MWFPNESLQFILNYHNSKINNDLFEKIVQNDCKKKVCNAIAEFIQAKREVLIMSEI